MTTALDRRPVVATRPARASRWQAPALVAMLGLAVSVIGSWIPSVWYDEAATISSSTRTWAQLWAEIGTVDLVHALYYAGMHVWFDLVGYTPFTLRLPSALAIAGAAALVVILGRQLGRARLGVIAGIVFCLLPRTTWAGGEGRSYAITALLAIGLTVLLLAASRAGRRRLWVAYGALAVISIVTFVYLAFIVAAHALTVLWWARRGRPARPVLLSWLLSAGIAAALTAPFVLAVSRQSGQVFWLDSFGASTLRGVLRRQWFMDATAFAIIGGAALVVGAVILLRSRRGREIAAVALPAAIVPTVLLVVLTVTTTPLYTPRYVTLSLPFVAILIGALIDALPSRRLVAIALVGVLALAVPQIIDQRSPGAKEHTDWGAVAALIASERQEAGADSRTALIYGTVQHHPRATSRVIAYSYPEAFVGTTDVTIETSAAESGRLWETQRPLTSSLDRLGGVDTVFLLTSRARDDTAAVTPVIAAAGWRLADITTIGDVHIVRYER